MLDCHSAPRSILPWLPQVKRLTVNFVDTGLSDRHFARDSFHEEVHIVYRTIGPDQIHASEADATLERGQIFQMNPDQLEAQFLLLEAKPEVAPIRPGLLADVFLDTGGDIVNRHSRLAGCLGRPSARR